MHQRKTWIDGLRGLAMLFVIYGHLCLGIRPYSLFSSPIKLPLFFAVTGYVFSFKGGNAKAFFRSLAQHLILPWLIFSAVYTAVKIAGGTAASEALLDFISGNVAWYIPCLIAAEIVFFLVRKATKPLWLQYALMLALAAAGYLISRPGTELCTFVGRALIVQFYIMIGYVFRNLEERITKPKLWPAVFFILYACIGAYVLIQHSSSIVDVQSNSYYDPLLFAAMVVCGCSFLFYYARCIKMPRWLAFIGRNTLIFYLFHARILDMLRPLINMIPHAVRSNIITGLPISLVICAVLCGICAVCSTLIDRYIPFLAGKPARKHN